MIHYLKLLRPHQYVKNGFVFLPMFFAMRMTETSLLIDTLLVALGFSFVASSIYILNDYRDREEDRHHPVKKHRPLASGQVTPSAAFMLMVLMFCGGMALVGLSSLHSLYITIGYFGMNILYSLKLKHIPILDINIIAIGFVLRLFVGAQVGDIPLSEWIILMTFLLALFLGLAKRRDDVLISAEGKDVRKSIDGYNLEFINGAMMIMASVTLVAYISYTIDEKVMERFGSEELYLTVFFVILGILRYMQLTFVYHATGSPTRVLLKDIFLQLTIIAWVAAFVVLIYLGI